MKIKSTQDNIDILADNLVYIRKIENWSLKDLGNLIGITKATISYIENKKAKMSKTQFIALMSVIEDEITDNENYKLDALMQLLYRSSLESGLTAELKTQAKAFIIGAAQTGMDDELFKKTMKEIYNKGFWRSESDSGDNNNTVAHQSKLYLDSLQTLINKGDNNDIQKDETNE